MYPNSQIDNLDGSFVANVVGSLRDLNKLGQPKTDHETAERIEQYFEFCQTHELRPGIESLCLALDVSRTTLFRWANGENCSREKARIVERAKSFCNSFLEQSLLQGKLSPPTGIFLLKNWANYRDSISIEEASVTKKYHEEERIRTPEEIMARHRNAQKPELPTFKEDEF